MENKEEELAKAKGLSIINSCITCEHIDNVLSYVDLFYKQFKNDDIRKELLLTLDDKKKELNCFNYE